MNDETRDQWRVITSIAPDARVLLSDEGNYYVSCGLERKVNGCLSSDCHYHRPTVEEAIAYTFRHITNPRCVWVVDAMRPTRREWRWHTTHKRFMPEGEGARDYTPAGAA